ncbi:BLUF domain-containing protein [Porticoccus litoralis]|uniref:BLUF domain-containing protein n=1 Tax=Porticoccus litoralis TaxID=434086 RepID=A0AAW8AXF8_9GAMM|nr:BLUF domain-containing protein [Porticoccus litoralis]MDP1519711.1 BLUF domain-containing protein [Porticoccus litoralis]
MYRIIYKSRSVAPLNWTLVQDIIMSSEPRNEQSGITGVLLASETHFLQALEGKFEDVNALFRRIFRDDRHEELTLISFSVIDARLFRGWGMLGIGTFNLNQEIESELVEKYGEEDGGIRFPLEEWAALSLINDIKLMRELPVWKQ